MASPLLPSPSSPCPPLRADARRNRERLLAAAESVLNERGVTASLDDIAKAAEVGNATLYRHFPSREKLIEAVYDQRIRGLCDRAGELLAAPEPGAALVAWLREVVAHLTTSRVLGEAFLAAHAVPAEDGKHGERGEHGEHGRPVGAEPPQIAAWHRAVQEAATPLVLAAREAGAVRSDLDAVELLTLTTAVARAGNPSQAGRFLDVLLTGVVPRNGESR